MNPKFIVIEGIDGSGKTTQIELLKNRMDRNHFDTFITQEPTNGKIGQLIRTVMAGEVKLNQAAISALYLADRLDHIQNPDYGMLTYLKNGVHVVSSRYYFSTLAFQGDILNLEWLFSCNELCKSLLKPDVTFFIQIDPEITMERLKNSRNSFDIYENYDKLFKTQELYLECFEKFGQDEKIITLDGSKPFQEIHDQIWSEIQLL